MPDLTPYSSQDLEAVLIPAYLQSTQLLGVAMLAAPVIYLMLALVFTSTAPVPTRPPDLMMVGMLNLVGLSQLFLSRRIADWSLRRVNLSRAFENGFRQGRGGVISGRGPVLAVLLRRHVVMRLAMLESMAVFGLLLAFLAGGLIWKDVRWTAVLLPCFIASGTIMGSFPNARELTAVFEQNLRGRP